MFSTLIIWIVHNLIACVGGGVYEVDEWTRHSDSVGGDYWISKINQSIVRLIPIQNQARQITGEGIEDQRLGYIWSD